MRPTLAFVGTVAIGLTLFEMNDEVELCYLHGKDVRVSDLTPHQRETARLASSCPRTKKIPNGRFCLRAYSPHSSVDWENRWREPKPGSLSRKVLRIVKDLEGHAVTIAELIEKAERQAEIQRKIYEEQHQRWLREEAERRRVESLKKAREELLCIVEAWAAARRIDEFFQDAERWAAALSETDGRVVLDRLRRAREMLGGVDALQRFRGWKAPEER